MSFRNFELYRNHNPPTGQTFRTIDVTEIGTFKKLNTNEIVLNGSKINISIKNFKANIPTIYDNDNIMSSILKYALEMCGSSINTNVQINYSNTFNTNDYDVQFMFFGDQTITDVPEILNSPEMMLYSSHPFSDDNQYLSFILSSESKLLRRQILGNTYVCVPLMAVRNSSSGWGSIEDIKVYDKDQYWFVETLKKVYGESVIVENVSEATIRNIESGETLTMNKTNNEPYFPSWSGSLRIGYIVFKYSTWLNFTLEEQKRIQNVSNSILLQSYNLLNRDDSQEIKRRLTIKPMKSWSLEHLRQFENAWRELLEDYKTTNPNIIKVFSTFNDLYSSTERTIQLKDYTLFQSGTTNSIISPIVLRRSWVELDMACLRRNYLRVKQWISGDGEKEIISMVKANSYGNSSTLVTREIEPLGSRYGVANVQEALHLMENSYISPNKIHIFGACCSSEERRTCVLYGFIPTISSYEEAQQYATIVNELNGSPLLYLTRPKSDISEDSTISIIPFKVQWSIDIGMGRIGTWRGSPTNDYEELQLIAHNIKDLETSGLQVESVWTHLNGADVAQDNEVAGESLNGTRGQLLIWDDLVNLVFKPIFGQTIKIHILNSAGLIRFPQYAYDRIRPGIILYGISPVSTLELDNIPLVNDIEPVMSVKSRVTLIRTLDKYRSVSYDRTFVVGCGNNGRPDGFPLKVATIGIGYEDGYMHSISNYIVPDGEDAPYVLIRGSKCTLLGRITMDQLMVDVTSIADDVVVGDVVTIMGVDGVHTITAGMISKWSGSIPWEIITTFGERMVIEPNNVGSNSTVEITPYDTTDDKYVKPVTYMNVASSTPDENACLTAGLNIESWNPYVA
jgi:alanine racemase